MRQKTNHAIYIDSYLEMYFVNIQSEINLKNNDSFFDGIIVVVVGVGPVAKEIVIEPILSLSSEIDIKNPFSNF